MQKCDDCGRPIKPRQPRYLIYKHQYVNELVRRLCDNCADEEWKKKKRKKS